MQIACLCSRKVGGGTPANGSPISIRPAGREAELFNDWPLVFPSVFASFFACDVLASTHAYLSPSSSLPLPLHLHLHLHLLVSLLMYFFLSLFTSLSLSLSPSASASTSSSSLLPYARAQPSAPVGLGLSGPGHDKSSRSLITWQLSCGQPYDFGWPPADWGAS